MITIFHSLLFLIALFLSPDLYANSCCGQTPASFSVLSLGQKLSLTSGYSIIESQGRVYENSKEFFVWDNKKRQIQSLNLELASELKNRHQVFLKSAFLTSLYQDAYNRGHAQDLADTLIGYSYELLPEYSFSYWKPILFVSLLVNIPTGKSIHEPGRLSEGADVTGHNQWGTGFGLTLRKVYFPFNFTIQVKALSMFAKDFAHKNVSSFYDSSASFLFNYASNLWGLGLNVGMLHNHLSPRRIGPANVRSDISQSTTVLVGIQRGVFENSSLALNYTDQTLLGRAQNTLLNRTFNISFNSNFY